MNPEMSRMEIPMPMMKMGRRCTETVSLTLNPSIRGHESSHPAIPIGSMYGIYTYIWLIFMVNVAKYTIHGYYGICPKIFGKFPRIQSYINYEDGLVVLTINFYEISREFRSGFLGSFFAWQQGKTWLKSEGLRLFGNEMRFFSTPYHPRDWYISLHLDTIFYH